jgi:hypothetical protein
MRFKVSKNLLDPHRQKDLINSKETNPRNSIWEFFI